MKLLLVVYGLFCNQVLRGGRLQQGAPGTKFAGAEAEQWESSEVHILRKRVASDECSEAQIKKKAKASVKTDRMASLDIIHMSGHIRNHHRINLDVYFVGLRMCLIC